MQQFEIDGYRCRRVLGEGATGDVYLADKDGEQVAIKVLDREAQGAMYPALHKNMQKEIDALNRVGTHSYIMKIVGYGFDVNWTKDNTTRTGDYIATEVVPNGELFDYVDNPMGGISEGVAKQLLLQMLAGLNFLHNAGLVNRDIKLENMLIGDDFKIRMADFGFATQLEGRNQDGQIETFLGTPGYMAPEIMEGRSYSGTAVDIYALGVVLFALVTKSTPFQSLGKLNPGQTVLASDKLYQLFCLDKNSYYGRYAQCNLSMEFRSLIDSMLNANPLLRPTHADLLMHPWVANQEVTAEQAQEDMRARKEAKEGKPVPMPSLQNRRGARAAVRGGPKRDGPDGNKIYVVGPLSEAQQADPNVKELMLNTHIANQNVPGSSLIYANIAAPDLFDWLTNVIQGREVIDNMTVDDRVWKMTYSIQRTIDPPEMDEDLRELFQEDMVQTVISTEITAEILRIDGEEGRNVIEFRRKDGSPQLYTDHVKWITEHMQQAEDIEENQQDQSSAAQAVAAQ